MISPYFFYINTANPSVTPKGVANSVQCILSAVRNVDKPVLQSQPEKYRHTFDTGINLSSIKGKHHYNETKKNS